MERWEKGAVRLPEMLVLTYVRMQQLAFSEEPRVVDGLWSRPEYPFSTPRVTSEYPLYPYKRVLKG